MMAVRLRILFLLAVGVSSLLQAHTYGTDDRIPVYSSKSPWASVGIIEGLPCTATLIYKNLAVTSALCVLEPGSQPAKVRKLGNFLGNMIDGKYTHKSAIKYVWWGTGDIDKNPGQNWAILVLSDNLGEKLGWMGTTTTPWNAINIVGYDQFLHGGKTPVASFDCKVTRRFKSGGFYHNCPTTQMSGAPLIFFTSETGAEIVGIQTASKKYGEEDGPKNFTKYDDSVANWAVATSQFLVRLNTLIKEQEAAGN